MNVSGASFTAIILAADRGPGDEVARAAGTACKSLVPVGGVPMVMRVLEALRGSRNVCDTILCGPPQPAIKTHPALDRLILSGNLQWMPSQATPSTSTLSVLEALAEDKAVLVTTADHALLNTKIVDYFCSQALASGCDVAVGLTRYDQVVAAYPGMRRTATRLSDAHYCSCNLFAFLTPAARKIADLWRRVENQRKKPWRIINLLGWMAVLRYATGNLSLIQAQELVSRRLAVEAAAVVLPFAEAAVDVDTVEDWRFVEGLVQPNEPVNHKTGFDRQPE